MANAVLMRPVLRTAAAMEGVLILIRMIIIVVPATKYVPAIIKPVFYAFALYLMNIVETRFAKIQRIAETAPKIAFAQILKDVRTIYVQITAETVFATLGRRKSAILTVSGVVITHVVQMKAFPTVLQIVHNLWFVEMESVQVMRTVAKIVGVRQASNV